MSEQDNTLPPGWDVNTIREGGGVTYSGGFWRVTSSDLARLLQKAYEQGRREVEEAVGAGGVQSPIRQHCKHEWVDARNRYVESGEICLRCGSIRATQPAGAKP